MNGDETWKKSENFPPSFLEEDLEYSNNLHNLNKDYPSCPERLIIIKVENLVPNLNDKKITFYTTRC